MKLNDPIVHEGEKGICFVRLRLYDVTQKHLGSKEVIYRNDFCSTKTCFA